ASNGDLARSEVPQTLCGTNDLKVPPGKAVREPYVLAGFGSNMQHYQFLLLSVLSRRMHQRQDLSLPPILALARRSGYSVTVQVQMRSSASTGD
ncbi:unnamed protein product, partial [Dovyalis caffra]